jgi:hypothetical protein
MNNEHLVREAQNAARRMYAVAAAYERSAVKAKHHGDADRSQKCRHAAAQHERDANRLVAMLALPYNDPRRPF